MSELARQLSAVASVNAALSGQAQALQRAHSELARWRREARDWQEAYTTLEQRHADKEQRLKEMSGRIQWLENKLAEAQATIRAQAADLGRDEQEWATRQHVQSPDQVCGSPTQTETPMSAPEETTDTLYIIERRYSTSDPWAPVAAHAATREGYARAEHEAACLAANGAHVRIVREETITRRAVLRGKRGRG